jgi:hypothetical protein
MTTFKVGQVVALRKTGNKDYRYISAVRRIHTIEYYFTDGYLPGKNKRDEFLSPFFYAGELRPLNAKERGR